MPSKAAELRELPDDELLARVDAAKEELFNLRFQLATGQLDNPTRIREVRHDVARIATVLREREIEAELDAAAVARLAASEAEPRRSSERRADVTTTTARARAAARCAPAWSCPTRWTRPCSSASTARSTHPLYRKTVRRSSKLAAHDEQNDAHVGDTVRVMETRPLSKSKRWRVVEIVERAK